MTKKRFDQSSKWRFLLVFPGFSIYAAMILIPIGMCLYLSFFDWDGIRENLSFVGLDNFWRAIQDSEFQTSLKTTLFFTVPGTILVNAIGIALAMLFNRPSRLSNFYRSAFFLPVLISTVAIGFIWKSLMSYSGIFNTLLAAFNIEAIDFLGDINIAPWSIMLVNIWHDVGFVSLLYLAGLQAIPSDLYDSASIDGASAWQRFGAITFPWLAPAFTSCIIFVFTGYMRLYDIPFVMTSGGPGGATQTLAIQTIRVGFNQNQFSYGSSLAMYMLFMIGIMSFVLTHFLRKREEQLIM